MGLRLFAIVICLASIFLSLPALDWFDINWKDARVQQATLAAGVVVVGWFVTNIFREASVILDRVEAQRDVLSALRAEIRDFEEALALSQDDAERFAAELEEHVLAVSDKPYFPFFPKVPDAIAASRFEEQLRVLPHRAVEPIVRFYATLADINVMVEDMRHADFKELAAERRLAMYLDYIELRFRVGQVADDALVAINDSLASGVLVLSDKLTHFSLGHLIGTRPHGKR